MAQDRYYNTFPCIEINSSFYQLPKLATAARWREAAPKGFEFSMKAWQAITHRATSPTYKRTRIDPRDREYCGHFGFNPTIRWAWDETYEIAQALRAFLVLFQCPASFAPTPENKTNLRRFFERAKRGKFLMGWEPRGAWETDVVDELCRELDLVHVVDPFKNPPPVVGKIHYFRLHGITTASYRYTNDDLHRLRQLCRGKSATYCLFNTIAMATDAQRFTKLLGATG